MDIVLDPNLYKISKDKIDNKQECVEHLSFFVGVLDFIIQYDIGKFFYSDNFITEFFVDDLEVPWNKNKIYTEGIISVFRRMIYPNTNYTDRVVNKKEKIKLPESFSYPNGLSSCDNLKQDLHYLLINKIDHLLFLAKCNCGVNSFIVSCESCKCGIANQINAIYDPEVNKFDIIRNHIVKSINFIDQFEIFPLNRYSQKLGELYYENINKNGIPNNSIKQTVGTEIALRNGYIYCSVLSDRNSTTENKRVVFRRPDNRYYLSIDFEIGAFEVFSENKVHLGEYKYDGSFHKKADPIKHQLK